MADHKFDASFIQVSAAFDKMLRAATPDQFLDKSFSLEDKRVHTLHKELEAYKKENALLRDR